jgi:L-ascorbate metabolism protein UlaG (beta-lactamase superfamily)
MTAHNTVELYRFVRPRTAIPVHYEGWPHFREGRAAIEAEPARAPADIAGSFRVLPIGAPVDLAT